MREASKVEKDDFFTKKKMCEERRNSFYNLKLCRRFLPDAPKIAVFYEDTLSKYKIVKGVCKC